MPVIGNKFCEVCNKNIVAKNFAAHKQSNAHKINEVQRRAAGPPAVSFPEARLEVSSSAGPTESLVQRATKAEARYAIKSNRAGPEVDRRSDGVAARPQVRSDSPAPLVQRSKSAQTKSAQTKSSAPGRDYQLIVNQLYNQYPQYKIYQDHRKSRNDPTAKRYRIDGDRGIFLDDMKDFIRKLYPEFKNKMRIGSTATFKKNLTGQEEKMKRHFYLDIINILDINSLDVESCISEMNTLIQEFEGKGSGWSLDRVKSVTIHYYKTRELTTGSYIPLPKELCKRTSLINPYNPNDDMCIIWCILAKLFPQNKDRDNTELYKPYINQIVNVNSYSYPISLKDIDRLEEENNLKINIFNYDKGLLPIRISNRFIVCGSTSVVPPVVIVKIR